MEIANTTVAPFPQAMVPAGDAATVAKLLREALGAGPHALILVFVDPDLDRDQLISALHESFGGVPVIGATTAGELGCFGMSEGCVSAVALPAQHFRVVYRYLQDVCSQRVVSGREVAEELLGELNACGNPATSATTFAMLLVDGLSIAEEILASSLNSGLGEITLIGGSAGDGLRFGTTAVFADGHAHQQGAVVALLQTDLPFQTFKTQHFVPGERRMVVTSADRSRRIVHELDGEPAAPYYARMLGIDQAKLDPTAFAKHPVVVRIGGANYVRSIQKVEANGSLTFYCAIEEGIVIRDAKGVGIVENLVETLADLTGQLGDPVLTIAFDCILRRLECQRDDKIDAVSAVMRGVRAVGFSTYGEQFNGMHINQTLTGVMFGAPRAT
jgi:hypothetical protein